MEKKRYTATGVLCALSMLVIILDGKTAVDSMRDGIALCVRTVVPALFPFFLLSGVITDCLLNGNFRVFGILGRICKLPKGSEAILGIGFLSGYPVGAQLIAQAYRDKRISVDTARRMLGFCSNAGPAFLFGMLSPIFEKPIVPWLLWLIHITSALLVGFLLPVSGNDDCRLNKTHFGGISVALNRAIRNMATVCGWVLLFRVLLGYCDRWFLWLFPTEIRVLFCGILELSNGCVLLLQLPAASTRFLLASIMLSFGGFCVMMQTQSVTQDLGMGLYFPGKVIQTLMSAALSIAVNPMIFPNEHFTLSSVPIAICLITAALLLTISIRRKKGVAFGRRMLYNTGS